MRIKTLNPSDTLRINELSQELLAQGKTVYKLGFGQSPFSPPARVIESLKSQAHHHYYAHVQGLPELREAMAAFHAPHLGFTPDKDQIFIAPGSKMSLFSAMAVFEAATLLLPTPSWVSYAPQATLLRHPVRWIDTSFDNQWKVTPEALEATLKTCDPDTQAILLLNSPNNPTGAVYHPEELKALAAVAKTHRTLILSDEIYGPLTFSAPHCSIAQFYPEGTLVTTGLSKWCGAGGWRLGALILPKSLKGHYATTLLGIASETYSTTAVPVQYAAIEAYSDIHSAQAFIDAEKTLLHTISTWCSGKLQHAGINVHPAEGGFYLYPDFSSFAESLAKKGITTSPKLCEHLLNDAGVALLPGTAFGHAADQLCARLCFVDFDGNALINTPEVLQATDDSIRTHTPSIFAGIEALTRWLHD